MLDEMPTFREVLARPMPERVAALGDPAVRDRLRHDFAHAPRQLAFDWPELLVASTRDEANATWTGRSVAELAVERAADPLDTFLDLSPRRGPTPPWFVIDRPVSREDREVILVPARPPAHDARIQ